MKTFLTDSFESFESFESFKALEALVTLKAKLKIAGLERAKNIEGTTEMPLTGLERAKNIEGTTEMPLTVLIDENGYEGGGANVNLVVDRKIVFNPGKNIHLTQPTQSLTVNPGGSLQSAPSSGLYAVDIDGTLGGSLAQLTVNGGQIGNFPEDNKLNPALMKAYQSTVSINGGVYTSSTLDTRATVSGSSQMGGAFGESQLSVSTSGSATVNFQYSSLGMTGEMTGTASLELDSGFGKAYFQGIADNSSANFEIRRQRLVTTDVRDVSFVLNEQRVVLAQVDSFKLEAGLSNSYTYTLTQGPNTVEYNEGNKINNSIITGPFRFNGISYDASWTINVNNLAAGAQKVGVGNSYRASVGADVVRVSAPKVQVYNTVSGLSSAENIKTEPTVSPGVTGRYNFGNGFTGTLGGTAPASYTTVTSTTSFSSQTVTVDQKAAYAVGVEYSFPSVTAALHPFIGFGYEKAKTTFSGSYPSVNLDQSGPYVTVGANYNRDPLVNVSARLTYPLSETATVAGAASSGSAYNVPENQKISVTLSLLVNF